MLHRPGKPKAKRGKKKKPGEQGSGLRVFAYIILFVPIMLAVSAYVMQEQIWVLLNESKKEKGRYVVELEVYRRYGDPVLKHIDLPDMSKEEQLRVDTFLHNLNWIADGIRVGNIALHELSSARSEADAIIGEDGEVDGAEALRLEHHINTVKAKLAASSDSR